MLLALALLAPRRTAPLLFEPISPATIWDPSCIRFRQRTHCISMYNSPNATDNALHATPNDPFRQLPPQPPWT